MNKNIILCGVGGQGTVLASKLIAASAMEKGMKVMSAETIGMAQRGGNVFSNIRISDEDEMYAVIELENAFDTDVAVYATTGREDYNDGVANKDLVDKRADILAAFTNYDNKRDFFFDNPTGKAQTKLAELKNQIDSDDELAGAVETFETDLEAAKKLVAGSMVAGGYDNIFDDLETRNLTDMTIATQAYIDFIYLFLILDK